MKEMVLFFKNEKTHFYPGHAHDYILLRIKTDVSVHDETGAV
jgi:hypothetical protein